MQELENYSKKITELNLFKKMHAPIFRKLEKLEAEAEQAKQELKEKIKQTKTSAENEIAKATYVERYSQYYDWEEFDKVAKPKEKESLKNAGGIKTEIDKKVFEVLVDEEIISKETKQKVFKEKFLNSSVIIKDKL